MTISWLIHLLILLLIVALVWQLARYVVRRMGLADPVPMIVDVLFAIVALLVVLNGLGVLGGPVWAVAGRQAGLLVGTVGP